MGGGRGATIPSELLRGSAQHLRRRTDVFEELGSNQTVKTFLRGLVHRSKNIVLAGSRSLREANMSETN